MLQYVQNKLDEIRLLHGGPLSCRLLRSSLPLARKIWQVVAPYQTYEADVLFTEAASLDPAPDGLSCIGWDGDEETIAAFKKWGDLAAGVFAEHGQETSSGGYREVVDLLLGDLPERLILDDNPDCGVRNHLPRLVQVPEVWLAEGDNLLDLASRFIKQVQGQLEKDVIAPSDVPEITAVKITTGPNSFQLTAEGVVSLQPLSLDAEFWAVFVLFVSRIAVDAPGEVVTWQELNPCVGMKDADPGRASDRLRKVLDDLRARLAKWGRPPDGEDWILTKRRKGCQLNTKCKWHLGKGLRRQYGRRSQSVDGRWTDPHRQAESSSDTKPYDNWRDEDTE